MRTKFYNFFSISLIFCLTFNQGCSQTNINKANQGKTFNILGEWKLISRKSIDSHYPLSKKESLKCTNHGVTFYINGIKVPNDNCFNGNSCKSSKYKVQKVKAIEYFENDLDYIKMIGIVKDSVTIVTTNCGLPFDIIAVLNNDNISCGMDGYQYFLRRVKKNKAKK